MLSPLLLVFLIKKKIPFSFRQTWQQKHVPVEDVCPAPQVMCSCR